MRHRGRYEGALSKRRVWRFVASGGGGAAPRSSLGSAQRYCLRVPTPRLIALTLAVLGCGPLACGNRQKPSEESASGSARAVLAAPPSAASATASTISPTAPASASSEASPADLACDLDGAWSKPLSWLHACDVNFAEAPSVLPPLRWEPCFDGAAAHPSCRRLKLPQNASLSLTNNHTLGELDAQTGHLALSWSCGAWGVDSVVDLHGRFRFAIGTGRNCRSTVIATRGEQVLIEVSDVRGDGTSNPDPGPAVVALAPLGGGEPKVVRRLTAGTWLDSPAFGGKLFGTVSGGDGVYVGLPSGDRPKVADASSPKNLTLVGETAFWSDGSKVKGWRTDLSTFELHTATKGNVEGLGTDGTDVVWSEPYGEAGACALFAGRWTGAPSGFVARPVLRHPCKDRHHDWQVGAGHASVMAANYDLLVARLRDGTSFRVRCAPRAQKNRICFDRQHLIGATELLASASIDGVETIVRIQLTDLGPALPPDPSLAPFASGDAAPHAPDAGSAPPPAGDRSQASH